MEAGRKEEEKNIQEREEDREHEREKMRLGKTEKEQQEEEEEVGQQHVEKKNGWPEDERSKMKT